MHIVIDARIRRASTGRYTDRLIQHLQDIDTDNKYTILVQPDDPWQPTSPNFQSVPCKFEQFSFNPIDQIAFSYLMYRLKADVAHFTMTQQPLFYFGNIVTTTHDLTMLRHMRPSRFPAWLHAIGMQMYKFLFWSAHKKSKKIIVPTKFVATDLATYQPFTKNKITQTYESSEPPISSNAEPINGVTKPFIFHVGQPLPHKNIERLIKSFEKLKASHRELLLVLPGKVKGVFLEDLNRWIVASPVRDSIIVPGYISDEQLKWLYQNAECYVLPSLSEGFGLPGLEAMSHGCPVVSSNATCLPEVYKDAAVYFDPYDLDDITEAVDRVITNVELRNSLVSNGRKLLPQYSWRKMTEETLAVYRSIN